MQQHFSQLSGRRSIGEYTSSTRDLHKPKNLTEAKGSCESLLAEGKRGQTESVESLGKREIVACSHFLKCLGYCLRNTDHCRVIDCSFKKVYNRNHSKQIIALV